MSGKRRGVGREEILEGGGGVTGTPVCTCSALSHPTLYDALCYFLKIDKTFHKCESNSIARH